MTDNLKHHKDEDLLKGQAVRNQKALWDKTLEFRFLLQKACSSSNRLPQLTGFAKSTVWHGEEAGLARQRSSWSGAEVEVLCRGGGWVLSKAWYADQRELASAIGLAVRQGVAEVKLELRQVWKVVLRQAVRTRKVVLRQGLRGHGLGYGLSFGKLEKPFGSLRKLESCGCAERQVLGTTDWEHIFIVAGPLPFGKGDWKEFLQAHCIGIPLNCRMELTAYDKVHVAALILEQWIAPWPCKVTARHSATSKLVVNVFSSLHLNN
ncbi:PREDICTED: putative uncharacterized DDB_G0270496 [Prunus dulcis]|uniref:PREDICTED: putative uncharacterized DDB_G0270496 n=1 Tax=Prunus dulcis TaxID=3755 RepID=A0A5E4GML0_PRUDU|nr:PREDICTED: putative uncharacterized DDB_G0270496 [Prunus dulcis]